MSTLAGCPCWSQVASKVVTTIGAVTLRWAVTESVAGVVVEPGQDLAVGVVVEGPVGHVGLPHLVGEFGFEPDVAGAGSFARVGGDLAGGDQVAADRCDRHDHAGLVVFEVPGDRGWAGVEAGGVELIA